MYVLSYDFFLSIINLDCKSLSFLVHFHAFYICHRKNLA